MANREAECVTIPEAAAILGIDRTTLYRKCKDGLIPAIKLPGKKRTSWRILRDDLISLIESRNGRSDD